MCVREMGETGGTAWMDGSQAELVTSCTDKWRIWVGVGRGQGDLASYKNQTPRLRASHSQARVSHTSPHTRAHPSRRSNKPQT